MNPCNFNMGDLEMINKIRTDDIIYLINEYVELNHKKAIVINHKNKELCDSLRGLDFTLCLKDIKNNNDLSLYTKEIYNTAEEVNMYILFDVGNIYFSYLLEFAKNIYNLNVEYIFLTRKSKLDTKNTKAFLVFYESYRILGNVLLLRRLK